MKACVTEEYGCATSPLAVLKDTGTVPRSLLRAHRRAGHRAGAAQRACV